MGTEEAGQSAVNRGVSAPQMGPAGTNTRRIVLASAGIASLLVGALALSVEGWDSSGPPSPGPAISSSSSTGPDRAGAAAAATRYAELLGGDKMFNPSARRSLVASVAHKSVVDQLQADLDADYTLAFNRRVGLDENGRPPAGSTFISRTLPTRTTVTAFSNTEAAVDVWASGQFGITGSSQTPVTTNWFTMHFNLRLVGTDWKLVKFTQTTGPEPDRQ